MRMPQVMEGIETHLGPLFRFFGDELAARFVPEADISRCSADDKVRWDQAGIARAR
jgi:hypothetical protein